MREQRAAGRQARLLRLVESNQPGGVAVVQAHLRRWGDGSCHPHAGVVLGLHCPYCGAGLVAILSRNDRAASAPALLARAGVCLHV